VNKNLVDDDDEKMNGFRIKVQLNQMKLNQIENEVNDSSLMMMDWNQRRWTVWWFYLL
jgi:hypothetical protein